MRNLIDFSSFKSLRHKLPFRDFSVKYVASGVETYTINGIRHAVHAGQYLLVNQFAEGHVEIDSPTEVRGICINISSELLQEAVAAHLRPDTAFPDPALDRYFSTPAFFENRHDASKTQVGQVLGSLEQYMKTQSKGMSCVPVALRRDICFDLAGRIVSDHIPIFKQLQAIPSLKTSTKKDLLRRIARGKEFLDAHCIGPIDIGSVARECCMSEYHFFRLFKQVYGFSPYQYALNNRLDHARRYLMEGDRLISDIAEQTGYADAQAFSKAFKKRFGVSPKGYLK